MIPLVAIASLLGGSLSSLPFPPSAPLPVDTTITVRASSSTLEFDPPTIALKQGMQVRLRFVNAGTLPHNFVLVRNEADIDALASAAMQQGGDYVPAALKAKLIAWTPLASPGQTVEVTFTVPPPGSYTYVCLMSGHANSMLGTLRSLH
ncbi:MAG TPA: plastocyanin/azurin family copper-binding protein [Gemmatimonadales bacterium]|jgi:plastocyanin|nr:plastocyanin/azurin family copper-binding protein [Gemmatimonadales bacterium]